MLEAMPTFLYIGEAAGSRVCPHAEIEAGLSGPCGGLVVSTCRGLGARFPVASSFPELFARTMVLPAREKYPSHDKDL